MLTKLTIENYALIKRLEIMPSHSFNIVTGETGAGKSIVLGALALMLGKRAEGTKHLYDKNKKCIIEGEFRIRAYKLQSFFKKHDLDYEESTIIRRELSPSGKSRSFVNDSPVTLDILRKLGVKLIDIHSQHDTLQLASNKFQLGIVDAYAENSKLKQQFKEDFKTYKIAFLAFETLKEKAIQIRKEADYNQFLFDELDALNLAEGEQDKAEHELKFLERAEDLKQKFSVCTELLSGEMNSVSESLKTIANHLYDIREFSDEYKQFHERANSSYIELQDLAGELSRAYDDIEYSPETIVNLQERLSKIYHLQQKHQVNSVEDLLGIQEELDKKMNEIQNIDEELLVAKENYQSLKQEMDVSAKALSDSRTAIFDKLCKELKDILSFVGMENASLSVQHKIIEATENGIDDFNMLFTANKGLPAQPLKSVASGGEFSRLMFSIKFILAGKTALPTIIFDEIDTGISGEIAMKMVKMMEKMAKKHQLMVITHLPQIASRGTQHYFVYKDHSDEKTMSNMRLLSSDERTLEIAKMIGGDKPSERALESAKELLG